MCDGIVKKANPEGVIGYVAVPFSKWAANIPYA